MRFWSIAPQVISRDEMALVCEGCDISPHTVEVVAPRLYLFGIPFLAGWKRLAIRCRGCHEQKKPGQLRRYLWRNWGMLGVTQWEGLCKFKRARRR